jgi:hypothetical protein
MNIDIRAVDVSDAGTFLNLFARNRGRALKKSEFLEIFSAAAKTAKITD